MREHLLDASRAPTASGVEPLQYESPADRGLLDKKAVDIELVIVFGIGDRRLQNLSDIARYAAPRKSQFRKRGRSGLATDRLGDKVELARARAQAPHGCGGFALVEPPFGGWLPHVSSFSPSCRRRGRKRSGSARTRRACARSCFR